MKYRSRTEITAQILEAANGGATKTRIMYKGMLSYAQLKEYLKVLADNGLLEIDSKTGGYRTTSKGLKFMGVYNEMGKLAFVAPETIQRKRHIESI